MTVSGSNSDASWGSLGSGGKIFGVKSISKEMHTGTVGGQSVVEKIGQHWVHYLMAYQNNVATGQYTFSKLSDSSIKKAVAVFDGGKFKYSDKYAAYTGAFTISKTYDSGKHKDLTQYKSDFKDNKDHVLLFSVLSSIQ